MVVWNIEAREQRLILKGALQKARAVDVLGVNVAATQMPSEESAFAFSMAPIYVSGLADDAEVKLEIR